MSIKWWRGDDRYNLPAGRVEPYRLWFEFLRHAAMDQTLTIDDAFYASWGDYRSLPFDKWWRHHWRTLFAVGVGVTEVAASDAHRIPTNSVLLSIPLHQDPRRSLEQIKAILENHGASARLSDMAEGQFGFTMGAASEGRVIHPSTRFLKNLSKVRLLLHVYRFWVQHPDLPDPARLDATARAYVSWANGWNKKVDANRWQRGKIEVPPAMSQYVAHLDAKGSRKRVSQHSGLVADASNRRQVARYIAKARRLAANVARGEFPSVYE